MSVFHGRTQKRQLCLVYMVMLVLIGVGELHAAPNRPATVGQNASASQTTLFDLNSICNSKAVQGLVSSLPIQVKVAEIPNGPKVPGGIKLAAPADKTPSYCQVTGSFVTNPKTGKTANFLAILPANWNRKFLQIGCFTHCGGFVVNDPTSPVSWIVTQGVPGEALEKGYASFSTDEGHASPDLGSWALKPNGEFDQDAVDDFYYRADQVLADMGQAFATAFYSRASGTSQTLLRSYFIGCSGGGRDALVAATFFPEKFDGFVAGSPYAFMPGAALQLPGITVLNQRSKDSALTPELMSKVNAIVKENCDALDGVKDGLIQNPAACDFKPSRDLPRCTAGASSDPCFTNSQIETVSAIITAVTDEHGNVVQPGYSVSELQNVSSLPEPQSDQTSAAPKGKEDWLESSFAGAVYKVFAHKNAPDFHTRSLYTFGSGGTGQVTDFRMIVPRIEVDRAAKATYMGIGVHADAMGGFLKTNRKLLLWANLSDQLLTPYMSINYYKQLAQMYGGYAKLQNSIRLFLLPDTAHCSMDGCGPSSFDAIDAIERWVEEGNAPDALLAKQYESKRIAQMPLPMVNYQKVLRTIPLCKFPEMAHYSGTGDVMEAANWSCPANDASMLKVGESGRQAGVLQ